MSQGIGVQGGGKRAGFSVVESLVFIALLTIGLLGLSASIVKSMALSETNREQAIAAEAGRKAIETLRSQPFSEVFERFNDYTPDNPATGSSPGPDFDVVGLNPSNADADGKVGEYVFPTSATPGVLSETPSNQFAGMGRDLNLDGDATDTDVTATRKVLPVMVVLRWRSATGEQELRLTTILADGP